MRSIGQNPTEDEILELVMESDLNGDGTIDFKEFIEMMKRKSSESDQTEVRYLLFFLMTRTFSIIVFERWVKSIQDDLICLEKNFFWKHFGWGVISCHY